VGKLAEVGEKKRQGCNAQPKEHQDRERSEDPAAARIEPIDDEMGVNAKQAEGEHGRPPTEAVSAIVVRAFGIEDVSLAILVRNYQSTVLQVGQKCHQRGVANLAGVKLPLERAAEIRQASATIQQFQEKELFFGEMKESKRNWVFDVPITQRTGLIRNELQVGPAPQRQSP
jgi:hypothetical protein